MLVGHNLLKIVLAASKISLQGHKSRTAKGRPTFESGGRFLFQRPRAWAHIAEAGVHPVQVVVSSEQPGSTG